MRRVHVYIDGFNLYFGIRSKGWQRCLWLDLYELSRSLLKPGQDLRAVKYFTARISTPEAKRKRQNTYLEALQASGTCKIYYGKYQMNPRKCHKCGYEDRVPNEKMTDVSIATELLTDAYEDKFETALVVSADSDLRPPIEAVLRRFPAKQVVSVFPPGRNSVALIRAASASFTLGKQKLRKSQLPATITKADGTSLVRPTEWN